MAILDEPLEEYDALLVSGFFWEFYPELTGNWEEDEEVWRTEIYPALLLSRFQYKNDGIHN